MTGEEIVATQNADYTSSRLGRGIERLLKGGAVERQCDRLIRPGRVQDRVSELDAAYAFDRGCDERLAVEGYAALVKRLGISTQE